MDISEDNNTSQQLPQYFFCDRFSEFRDVFLGLGTLERYSPQDRLIIQDANSDYCYYLVEGLVKLCMKGANGKEHIVCFFGEDCYLPLNNHDEFRHWLSSESIYIKAFSEAVAVKIPRDKMNSLFSDKYFNQRVFTLISDLVMLLLYRNINSSSCKSMNKICNFLWVYINDLYPRNIILTQSQIAQVVGTTKLEVARALKILRDSGCVATGRNKITITDKDKFNTLCDTNILPLQKRTPQRRLDNRYRQ